MLSGAHSGNVLRDWAVSARRFVDHDLTQITGVSLSSPWSDLSLCNVEKAFLEKFRGKKIPPDVNIEYMYFLGEGLIRKFGGKWKILAGDSVGLPEVGQGYGVSYDTAEEFIDVISSMPSLAVAFGTGTHWLSIFSSTDKLLTGSD